MKQFTRITMLSMLLLIASCGGNDDTIVMPTPVETPAVTIALPDLTGLSIDENSAVNAEITAILPVLGNYNNQPISYTILSQTPAGAVKMNAGNKMLVADESVFDFETNTEVTGQIQITIDDVTDTTNFKITINDDSSDNVTISFADISVAIDENPSVNDVVITPMATVTIGSGNGIAAAPVYSIVSQSISGAVTISNNEIVVADPSIFDYETNTSVTGVIQANVGNVSTTANFEITINDIIEAEKFVTTWGTTMANEDITIYVNADDAALGFNFGYDYNYTIDWGDGTVESGKTGDATA